MSKSLTSRSTPPIYIRDTNCDLKRIADILKTVNIILIKDYCFRSYQNGNSTVHTNLGEIHSQMFASFQSNGVKCFTRSPKELTDVFLTLKGINPCYDEKDTFQALMDANFVNVEVIKVSEFRPKNVPEARKGLLSFLVQLKNGSETSRVTNHDLLLGQIVKWESPDRSQIVQCKKCQRFGHVARLCNLGYRCVKCPNKHEPGSWQLEKQNNNAVNSEKQTQPFCMNCNNYGHPASYRGCPVLQKFQSKADSDKKLINEKKIDKV